MNFAIQSRERVVQAFPLPLRNSGFGAPGPAHPRINFVFNAVMIRRAKQQLSHNGNYFAAARDVFVCAEPAIDSQSSRRNGSTSVTSPIDWNGC
jgi:hypothetical protein